MFSTTKTSNGYFDCNWNGVKVAGYEIFNGSHGLSGNGPNSYGISKPDGSMVSGVTLQAAKKSVAFWFSQKAKKGEL